MSVRAVLDRDRIQHLHTSEDYFVQPYLDGSKDCNESSDGEPGADTNELTFRRVKTLYAMLCVGPEAL